MCDSKMHWVDQCPHKDDNAAASVTENETEHDQENYEEVNIVLKTEEYADIAKSEVFVAEGSKSAMIDTACTITVASQIWLENFKSNRTEQTLKEIETFRSNTRFKFSGGRKVKSLNRVIFPVVIANNHCKVNAEIVYKNIPLLQSKSSLKKCGIINMNNDKATVFGEKVVLHQSGSRHYCIDILAIFTSNNKCQEVLMLETNLP